MPQVPITISTPLPAEDLVFESMSYDAGLSTLGEMHVNLTSERSDIDSDDLLGQPVSIKVLRRDESVRYFNGIVSRFGVGRHLGRHFTYQATIRPWLWFLTRTSDCRIFQDMTVPDIVKAVFGDHGIADFKFSLFRTYRKWVYCVQYRESDYNFVARLLEHEGIYWYFEHTEGKHQMVLVDSQSSHDTIPDYETLPYFANVESNPPDLDYASRWTWTNAVETGSTAQRSYDFERPSTLLEATMKHGRKHALSSEEEFDYQGDWVQKSDGDQWNGDRLDEIQTRHSNARGSSNSQGLTVGHLFSLERHPHETQNAKYLVVSTSIRCNVAPEESGGDPVTYDCDFTAIPADPQYRPPRMTRKPFVQGPQTAVVVGPGGDEIFTDKYGRVKVQFHWDRRGKKNESSSCWVRVSHPWAGKNFGMIHTPRIGQEVVVDFLEGDPDQPLITGRVYNAEQMPPWELPANATQSGILTRSSKGGAVSNANALRFEDKKGSEQVWLHAEKNQDIEVENDETHWVGHDRKKTIDHDETVHVKHDRTETVDNDETITVHHDRQERVDRDETISIGRDRTMTIDRDKTETVTRNKSITVDGRHLETIAKTMEINVGASLTESVAVNYSETVGAAMELTVGAALAISVGGALLESVGAVKATSIGGSLNESIGGGKSVTVGGTSSQTVAKAMTLDVADNLTETIAGKHTTTVTKEYLLQAKKIQLKADDEISLKVGSAEIVMKKNGDITINGAKIDVKGSGNVTIKGSKIAGN